MKAKDWWFWLLLAETMALTGTWLTKNRMKSINTETIMIISALIWQRVRIETQKGILKWSFFRCDLECGTNNEGCWTYKNMILQVKDCIDCLKVINEKSMIHNKKFFQGWRTAASVINARRRRCLSNLATTTIVAHRHILAKGITELKASTSLLQHQNMTSNDKTIWNQSYLKEYDGLKNIDMQKVITGEEYLAFKNT